MQRFCKIMSDINMDIYSKHVLNRYEYQIKKNNYRQNHIKMIRQYSYHPCLEFHSLNTKSHQNFQVIEYQKNSQQNFTYKYFLIQCLMTMVTDYTFYFKINFHIFIYCIYVQPVLKQFLSIFKICNYMKILDQTQIQHQLTKINIHFTPEIIKDVQGFITKYIGPLYPQDSLYHIPAACAIICQTAQITTIDKTSKTKTGISIENVMRHIGTLSKEKFLDTIEEQIFKGDPNIHYLAQKVVNIKIAFRIFKKYKSIFSRLSTKAKIPMNNIEELQAFFWIIYLIVQYKLDVQANLNLRLKILALLFQEIFCKYFGQLNKQEIREYITSNDNFPELPQITAEEDTTIRKQIYQEVNGTFKKRDASASPNYNNMISHLPLMTRLVDDLSTKYEKLYPLENKYIDEITFLQLTKNLTPQAFNFKNHSQQITKVINFGNDSDQDDGQEIQDEMKTQQKKPNFPKMDNSYDSIASDLFGCVSLYPKKYGIGSKNTKPMSDYTPVSLGNSKNTWAHQFISNYNFQVEKQMRNYFQKRGANYDQFVFLVRQRIQDKIQCLNRYNINKDKSIVETLRMFLAFTFQLLSHNPNYEILSKNTANALLCVSVHLYNWATKHQTLQLQKYCEAYQSDLLSCLTVIYDIYKNVRLPYIIKQHLSQRQKQVLIKELWDTDRGYLLLIQGRTSSTEIHNRLNNVIYERIKQICDANNVNLVEVKKIQALLKEIMTKKPQMLQRNKLDQIIICSISACLNLNNTKYNLALSTIFKSYNSIPLGFHSNREMISATQTEDTPMSMLQFYNRVFIHQVQDMMSRQENPKYLYTPIRQNHLKNLKDYLANSTISRYAEGYFQRSALSGKGGLENYRKQILQKMKSSQPTERYEQQCQSPHFGTNSQSGDNSGLSLKRRHTFGREEQN